MIWLLATVAGGVGAVLRVVLTWWVNLRWSPPWGTVTANVAGTLGLVALIAAGVSSDTDFVVGAGLFGGMTTFSTWMLDGVSRASAGDVAGAMRHFALVGAAAVVLAALLLQLG